MFLDQKLISLPQKHMFSVQKHTYHALKHKIVSIINSKVLQQKNKNQASRCDKRPA